MTTTYQELKLRLARSAFRSRFRLGPADRALIAEKGWSVIRAHARRIIETRLAPASPANDGKQTPMRGHPVFVAQHATGCCCRGCLRKWHGIPQGRALTEEEIDVVVAVLLGWMSDQAGDLTDIPRTPELF